MRRKTSLLVAVAGLILTLTAAGIFMYFEWRSYQEKMEILYVALEQEQAGEELFVTVTELLKGQAQADTGNAEERLKTYGYEKEFPNHYKKSLLHSYEWTAGVCGVLYLGFLFLFLGERKREERRRNAEFLELENLIIELREDGAGNILKAASNPFPIAGDKARGEEFERLLMELVSLNDSLTLLRHQSKREKEEMFIFQIKNLIMRF